MQIFEFRPYSLKEMSYFYQIDKRTFLRLLKPFAQEIGERTGWYFNVRQVEVIILKLGMPRTETFCIANWN